jgi:hypothetical protein
MRVCAHCKHDTHDARISYCPKCGCRLRKPMMIYFAHFEMTTNRQANYDYCCKLLDYLFVKKIAVFYEIKGNYVLFYRQLDDQDMKVEGLFHVKSSQHKPLAEKWSNRVKPFDTLRNRMMGSKR